VHSERRCSAVVYIRRLAVTSCYTASVVRSMANDNETGRVWKESFVLIEVLFRNLVDGTKEINVKPLSKQPMFESRFEPSTLRMQN
jgi:hypothetical protein